MNSPSITRRWPGSSSHSNPYAPISVMPQWSKTRAPHSSSMRSRVAGMLPPGSPATMSERTADPGRSTPSRRATSARCSAYVGVHVTTVARCSTSALTRAVVESPPAGKVQHSSCAAASNAPQNPMNGPNENGTKTRSLLRSPAPRNTCFQHSTNHCHDSVVSSQRRGTPPIVPDVWWIRTYCSRGNVSPDPYGGCSD